MRLRTNTRNLVLQDWLFPDEQDVLERAIADVLSPVAPSQQFVAALEAGLLQTAGQRAEQQPAHHWARALGVLGGGLLSIVGGVVIWSLWQSYHEQARVKGGRPRSLAAVEEQAVAA